jgi:hypothetical protein
MDRSRLAGLILLALAAVSLFIALFVPLPVGSRTVPAGTAWTVSSDSWATVTVTVAWSANAGATQVFVTSAMPSCTHPTGVVASGFGAQGSISTDFHTGTTYNIFACTGSNWETARFTLSATGTPNLAEPLEVVGAILAFFGVVLLLRRTGTAPPRRRFAPHRP